MSLGDILSMLTGGGAANTPQQPQQPASGADQVASLLGSLLGGAQAGAPAAQPTAPGAGDMAASLLGSLLGGSQAAAPAAQPAAPAAGQAAPNDMLSMILGVIQSPMGASLLQPIVNNIATKLGIPPQTALIVVTFAIQYLATNHASKVASGEEDLAGVLKQHSKTKFVQTNNISSQLANQTGLDEETAAKAMAEVFKLLGASSK